MNKPQLNAASAASRFGLIALLSIGTAIAQTATTTTTPTKEEPQVMEKFQVTGSYLPVSSTVTANPVVTLQSSDMGRIGATDPLQMLRELTPYFSGNGNLGTESNNGYGGESNVSLRNLTTLVLVNGNRMPISGFSTDNGTGGLVDLNTIPTAMIDRIEILKDGASTIYGSDAIGGVVNVILKKDYNGFETGARYSTTKNGDYKTRNVYISGGVSQPGASITFGAQHFENTPLLTTDRPLTTLDPAGIAKLGYNVTSSVFSGSYPGRVNSDILAGSPLAVGAPKYNAAIQTPPAKTDPNAAPQTLAQLEAAGIYIPVNSTPAFASVGSTSILNTTLYGNPLVVSTRRSEYVLNANKELFGKSLEVFGDFLYSQTLNHGSGLAPAPIAGAGPAGQNSLSIPANNPYNLFGITLGVGAPAGAPTVRQRTVELGKRDDVLETNTWRFVGGFKGEINERYSWEATYNYSRSSDTQTEVGGGNGANMNTAMMPLIVNGKYVYNAAGRPLSLLTDANGNNLPVYDFLALPGFNDPTTLDALKVTLFKKESADLRDISVRLRGKPFDLPAGPLAFALGVEARHEAVSASVDGLYANGLALGYPPAQTYPGGGNSRNTKGIFLETGVPLISPKDGVPGFYTLDATLADRYEKIEPGGHANTPKFGIRWLPFDDSFVVRSTWAKGFIAPSIFNLFGPSNANSPSFTIAQGNGSSGPGGSLNTHVVLQGSSVELSNPGLAPSHSKSYTVGFVYSPKQVKGLTVTVDYYNITQDQVGSIDYTAIAADLNAKGAASLYNQDPLHLGAGFVFADGEKLTSNAPNQVNSTNFGSVSVVRNPAGDQKTDGLDISVDYHFKTDSIGNFAVGVSSTILFNFKFRATQADPYLQYARLMTDSTTGGAGYEGLLPGYVLKPYVNYGYKAWTASLSGTYLPKVTVPGTLFGGASTTNDYTINGKASETPTYFKMDASVSYRMPDFGRSWLRNVTWTVGADNVFNKSAPYVPGDGSFVAENNTVKNAYDIIGRFWFFDLKKSF
ncbi:MAG TPA: TonB-dependent receptor plug domain-containing protein [Opitutaceae bacterium]|nr:TonB-dependent receptor plug domain-containing protein [Opitutaceae bacterium]